MSLYLHFAKKIDGASYTVANTPASCHLYENYVTAIKSYGISELSEQLRFVHGLSNALISRQRYTISQK